ncbi:MAG TPA: aminoglycoside phosphotransferase family protein [Candidatus Dormibacteraeota bacterium]|nr:aminoglycoside phosphotransferase family protein [Candidatus Dormibacteraeota bacterium]
MAGTRRHDNEIAVDEGLARRLLQAQFPEWADLGLVLVEPSGTDHTIFRLGHEMVVRFPVMEYATRQAAKEARWLPFLAPQVPLALPVPLAMGEPGEGYRWNWSIVSWIEGQQARADNLDPIPAALDLARFIRALQACDPTDGPPAGADTGQRGLPVRVWVDAVAHYAEPMKDDPFIRRALEVWHEALEVPDWDRPPVWFHGDLSGNLIAREGRLVGAIDSGYGIGDPACDLMPGWILFRGEARQVFFDKVGLDEATQERARGWALGPALIGMGYYRKVPHLLANCRGSIEGALAE